MTVCKFFQQGNCKFGDRCRFEHPRGQQQQGYRGGFSGGGGGGDSYGFNSQNRFAAFGNDNRRQQNASQPAKDPTAKEILDAISADMQLWTQSKMWPLSCFTYGKEGKCIPGFEDLSAEEVRYEAYQAQKSGGTAIQAYTQKITQLITEYKNKRQALVSPDPQTKQKLMSMLIDIKNTSSSSSAFNSNTGQNLFGKSSGPSTPNVNPFGGGTSVFGGGGTSTSNQNAFGASASGASIFGAAAQTPSNVNPFASTAKSNPFGGGNTGQSSSVSVFSKGVTNNASSGNAFGASPSPSVFGSSTNSFSNTGNTGLFGKPATTSGSVFGGGQSSNAFGSTGFGIGNTNSSFPGNNAQATPSPFGAAPSNPMGGGFGLANQQTNTVTGSQAQASTQKDQSKKTSIYTPLDQLTADEKSQFSAENFTLGKIPTRPPPKEMV